MDENLLALIARLRTQGPMADIAGPSVMDGYDQLSPLEVLRGAGKSAAEYVADAPAKAVNTSLPGALIKALMTRGENPLPVPSESPELQGYGPAYEFGRSLPDALLSALALKPPGVPSAARMASPNQAGQISVAGPKATSGRRIKSGERVGRYTGAPPGVDSPQAYSAVIDRYKKDAEIGVIGRDWYSDIGKEIKRWSPDVETARNFAENFAATSPQATVPSNLTFAIKGHNQAVLGAPVNTGRYPQAMSPLIEDIYGGGGGITGLKRSPFAMNMAVGGDFAPPGVTRPVHDMWTAASVGYPDGMIPGEAGHAFMDKVVRAAEGRLNKSAFGGFGDWNDLNTQAANWVGSRIRAGQMTPEDAARMPSTLFNPRAARITQEVTPGTNTGHRSGLNTAPQSVREDYFRALTDALLDPNTGQSRIAQKLGAMSPKVVRQRGVFEGDINPGQITETLAAAPTGAKPGTPDLGPADRKLTESVMRAHDLLTQQKAGAWHKIVADTGPRAADFAYLRADLSDDALRALERRISKEFDGGAFIVSTDGGKVGIAGPGAKDFGKKVQEIAKDIGAETSWHKAALGYQEYPYGEPGAVTKDFLRFAEDPAYPALSGKMEGLLRDLAPDVAKAQKPFNAEYPASALVDNLLRILGDGGGFKGLRSAAERGLVPAIGATTLGYGLLGQPEDR